MCRSRTKVTDGHENEHEKQSRRFWVCFVIFPFSLKIKQKQQQDFQCNYIHEQLYVEAVKGCHVNAVPKGAI